MNNMKNAQIFPLKTPPLKHIHKYNAVLLGIFLCMHLVTHVSGVFGIATYNTVQGAMRIIYRNPVAETILLISITIQVIIGIILLVKSLRHARPAGFWSWVQIISGGYFAIFIIQHMYSLGVARLLFELETDFYWPASVMSGPPYFYYFTVYYFLGVWSVLAHIGAGVRYALIDRDREKLGNRIGFSFLIGGAMVSAFILPILAGAYFEINMPSEWIDYLRFYVPGFEPW